MQEIELFASLERAIKCVAQYILYATNVLEIAFILIDISESLYEPSLFINHYLYENAHYLLVVPVFYNISNYLVH